MGEVLWMSQQTSVHSFGLGQWCCLLLIAGLGVLVYGLLQATTIHVYYKNRSTQHTGESERCAAVLVLCNVKGAASITRMTQHLLRVLGLVGLLLCTQTHPLSRACKNLHETNQTETVWVLLWAVSGLREAMG